jgi:Amt family ammonium transporter
MVQSKSTFASFWMFIFLISSLSFFFFFPFSFRLSTFGALGRPFFDYAGSSVVHSIGGMASLVGVIVLGPRHGRFDANGKPKFSNFVPHSVPHFSLGVFILLVGFIGMLAPSCFERLSSSLTSIYFLPQASTSARRLPLHQRWQRTHNVRESLILRISSFRTSDILRE